MTNRRRIFKYILWNLLEFFIAGVLFMFLYEFIYIISLRIYDTFKHPIFNRIIDLFINMKNNYFGDNIYIFIGVVLFSSIYSIVTFRKNRSLANLFDNMSEMAKGNLDKKIEINTRGDIGEFADNINDIVKQLKDITIEERNAQQTKTDLITNVSHDLRTPLTSIIGYLNLIEEGKYKDEVELMYYVDIAYEKSLSLNLLINDLFELTKMQNNVVAFNKIEINIVELLSQLVSQFEVQLREENMESRINFPKEKILIEADPMRLVRAFENLLTNAIRYGKEGHYVDINIDKDENFVAVQVINYSQTIPVVDLPHIFDRFYRVEKSRNTVKGGSGLGLAIAKSIVESHDGKIEAISENNKTIFQIKLPYIKKRKL